MTKPVAVVISDIHFNMNNLEVATSALKSAIRKSKELNIPLVIAGDLHDTKANMRAEVVNRLLDLMPHGDTAEIFILCGNHDLVNEKSKDSGLNYLDSLNTTIVDSPTVLNDNITMLPYYSDQEELKSVLSKIAKGSILIMHQGFLGAHMGDYIRDTSSISTKYIKDFIVISGHYHKHQKIGKLTYIGSPYTITFGEANDGDKGFLILNGDGTYTREVLNLRKHIIIERTTDNLYYTSVETTEQDIVKLVVSGPYNELQKIDKKAVGEALIGHSNFRLDLVPTDSKPDQVSHTKDMTDDKYMDSIIDSLESADDSKKRLKELYREIIKDRT